MVIERVLEATPEVVAALGRLIPQLTEDSSPPGADDIAALLEVDASVLLIARLPERNGEIVGVGSLSVYRVPTGIRAIIEDVVVDGSARGRGTGEALVAQLLRIAREMGAKGVSLTSSPRRTAANRLYARMGFSLRKTNSYYYKFS